MLSLEQRNSYYSGTFNPTLRRFYKGTFLEIPSETKIRIGNINYAFDHTQGFHVKVDAH